ncbi:MAG: transcriptional repressor [Deltaproteobacteria bacterium]|nr:transcriptional repressor [Deltaproteobacteria bacterium]
MDAAEEAAALHRQLDDYLATEGLRRTTQRQQILDTFIAHGGHLTAEQVVSLVQDEYAGIGQATIYRTLKLLVDAEILDSHFLTDSVAHYELHRPGDRHHDHLVCHTCGRVIEFYDPDIEARQEALARLHGLRLVGHTHVIHTECLDPERCPHRQGER